MADCELLGLFADQAAAALENARLYETLEVRLSRLQILTHLNQVVSSSLDMDKVLSEIARCHQTHGSTVCAFWIADESAQTLERCRFGRVPGTDFASRQMPFGQGVVGWVARRRSLHIPTFTLMRASRSKTGGATMHSAVYLPSLSSSKTRCLAS